MYLEIIKNIYSCLFQWEESSLQFLTVKIMLQGLTFIFQTYVCFELLVTGNMDVNPN